MDMIRRYEIKLENAQEYIKEWAAKMVKEPSHEMQWGMGAFHAAAEVAIYADVVRVLKDGVTLAVVREEMLRIALRQSRYPSRSTSPCSNLMEQETAAVAAEVAEDLMWHIKAEEAK